MSKRILVVEDHEDNRKIMRDLLSSAGYEATREIKAKPALRDVPIIATTSYALNGDENKTLEAGCDAYFAKPFSPRKLLDKIREFIPQG